MTSKEQLIKKLFANQCSKEELSLLFDLIQKEDTADADDVMEELLGQMHNVPKLDTATSDEIMNLVLEKTNNLDRQHSVLKPLPTKSKRFVWLKYAAAVLLLVTVGWYTFQLTNDDTQLLVTTGYGEQQNVKLPDGSLVKLNANSTITFSNEWDKLENRQVWLRGEAFFEVEKKPATNQKFQVITKDLTVEVLGTHFNVNTHRKETKVFLEEGKVNLKLDGLEKELLMNPGEMISYSKKEKIIPVKRQVTSINYPSWKNGIQSFNNTSLKKVFEKFEEIYGVSIRLEKTADYTRKITTGIPINNQAEAIAILEATLGNLKIMVEEKK